MADRITAEKLDEVLQNQWALTNHLDMEEWIEALGFDWESTCEWVAAYAHTNFAAANQMAFRAVARGRPEDAVNELIAAVAAAVSRGLTIGFVLGQEAEQQKRSKR